MRHQTGRGDQVTIRRKLVTALANDAARPDLAAVGALGPASYWASCSTSWSGSGATTSCATSRRTSRSSTHLPSDLPRDLPFAVLVARPGAPASRATSCSGPVWRAATVVIAAKLARRTRRRALAIRPITGDRRLHRDTQQVPRRGTCKCVRAGSLVLRRRGRGDYACFREGVQGPPCRWHSRVPEDARMRSDGGREVSREGNLSMCARRICCSASALATGQAGLPRRPCGPSGRRRGLLPRRAGVPGELGRAATHERTPAASRSPVRWHAPEERAGSLRHHPLATLSVLHERQIRRAHICRFPSGQPAGPPVRHRADDHGHVAWQVSSDLRRALVTALRRRVSQGLGSMRCWPTFPGGSETVQLAARRLPWLRRPITSKRW